MLARKIMALFTAFVLVVGLWPAAAVASVDEGLVAASLAAADAVTEDEPNDLQEEATELPTNVVVSGKVYNETAVLYAQWVEAKYEVKFMANGGSGSMAAQAIYRGESANLNANAFTRAGYKFKGWNTKANGSGIAFKNKQKVINLAKSGRRVKLYAQWELVKTIKVAGFSLKLPEYWRGKVTYSTNENDGVYNVGTLTHVVDKKSGSLIVIHCAKKKKFKRMSGWGDVVGIGKIIGKRYKVEVYMLDWPWMTRGGGSRYYNASSLRKADRAIQMVTGGKCKSCGSQGTKSFEKSRKLAVKYLKKNIVKQIKVS